MFIDKQLGQDRKWINIDSDLIAENSYLYKKYDIDKETIEYAMDKNERAHMDYNRENGTITFIYNVLDLEKDKEYYETIPMTFIAVSYTHLASLYFGRRCVECFPNPGCCLSSKDKSGCFCSDGVKW